MAFSAILIPPWRTFLNSDAPKKVEKKETFLEKCFDMIVEVSSLDIQKKLIHTRGISNQSPPTNVSRQKKINRHPEPMELSLMDQARQEVEVSNDENQSQDHFILLEEEFKRAFRRLNKLAGVDNILGQKHYNFRSHSLWYPSRSGPDLDTRCLASSE